MGTLPPDPVPVSRRATLGMLLGTGVIGAAWGTGFTALNGVRSPSATVVGADEWQLTLIEAGRCRVVIMMGTPDQSIGETLALVMGSFRQRIDMVIGAPAPLNRLPPGYRARWNVQNTIVLGGAATQIFTGKRGSITSPTLVRLGSRLKLSFTPVIGNRWRASDASAGVPDRWIVSVESNSATICLAERLEDIAAASATPFAVAVAPQGDLRGAWSRNPLSAIAINNGHVPPAAITSGQEAPGGRRWLVAVFRDDPVHLAFVGNGVELPDWARSVRFTDGVD